MGLRGIVQTWSGVPSNPTPVTSHYFQRQFQLFAVTLQGTSRGKAHKASMWASHGTIAVRADPWGPRPWLDASLGLLGNWANYFTSLTSVFLQTPACGKKQFQSPLLVAPKVVVSIQSWEGWTRSSSISVKQRGGTHVRISDQLEPLFKTDLDQQRTGQALAFHQRKPV